MTAFVLACSLGCSTETDGDDTGSNTDTSRTDMGDSNSDASKSDTTTDTSNPDTSADLSAGCDPCDYIPENTYTETNAFMGFTVTSIAGGRELPILVRVPADASGPLPVVIWSHSGSWGATKHTQHTTWSETFARAGYVVVHFSTVKPTLAELQNMCMSVGVADAAACEDLSVSGEFTDDSADNPFRAISIARAEDPKAVLADLPRIAERLAQNGITLDVSSVSMAGWSGGSQSVLQLAGAAVEASVLYLIRRRTSLLESIINFLLVK